METASEGPADGEAPAEDEVAAGGEAEAEPVGAGTSASVEEQA